MGILRASTLYPLNSTTVDTGAGIDIRLLSDAEAGATDEDQSVSFTHTQDNVNRTFDPDTAGVTAANDSDSLQKLGWATRLTEDMTPTDDTDCDAVLLAGQFHVNLHVWANQSGGTYATGTLNPLFKISLWRYNLSANTGTLICTGSNAGVSWICGGVGADLGTYKDCTVTTTVPSLVTFAAGEVLLLQVGLNTQTVPNPTIGTGTFTIVLSIDYSGTAVVWEGSQGIRQACTLSHSLVGKGVAGRSLAGTISRDVVGKGVSSSTKVAVVAKTFSLVGKGTVTNTKNVTPSMFNLIGKGTSTMSRSVVAARSFTLTGVGTVTRLLQLALSRLAVGKGTATSSKATTVAKSFDLVGKGTVTELHPLTANRTFTLVGKGVVTGRIEIPIDEVPEGGGGTVVKHPVYIFDD